MNLDYSELEQQELPLDEYVCIDSREGKMVYSYIRKDLPKEYIPTFERHLSLCFHCQEIILMWEITLDTARKELEKKEQLESHQADIYEQQGARDNKHAPFFVGLVLSLIAWLKQPRYVVIRRYAFAVVVFAAVTASILSPILISRRNVSQPEEETAQNHQVSPSLPPNIIHDGGPESNTQVGESQSNKNSPERQTTDRSPTKKSAISRNQLAYAQIVNLSNSSGVEEDDRGANNVEAYEPPIKIVLSRTHDTNLNIKLPKNSKKGMYLVRIQEPAFYKSKVISDLAESLDGKELSISLNLRELPTGEYSLFITRESPSGSEYLVRYPVRVVDPGRRKGSNN